MWLLFRSNRPTLRPHSSHTDSITWILLAKLQSRIWARIQCQLTLNGATEANSASRSFVLHFIVLTILVLRCVLMLHFGDIVVKLRLSKRFCLWTLTSLPRWGSLEEWLPTVYRKKVVYVFDCIQLKIFNCTFLLQRRGSGKMQFSKPRLTVIYSAHDISDMYKICD